LWKNIAPIENNAEIQGVFANVKKNFWRRGEKNSGSTGIGGEVFNLSQETR
jgi:hypothetical protein